MSLLKHIPNTVTSMNLFAGTLSIVYSAQDDYKMAFYMIILAAVFDFFDGFLARILNATGEYGKILDSLADIVSFGVAPGIMLFYTIQSSSIPSCAILQQLPPLSYAPLIIPVFSALRLAKFHLDTRQTSAFIGLPTPANALFWGSLLVMLQQQNFILGNLPVLPAYLILLALLSSLLLVSEIPMFSLKIKTLSFRKNQILYIFALITLILLVLLGWNAIALIIFLYIIINIIQVLTRLKK